MNKKKKKKKEEEEEEEEEEKMKIPGAAWEAIGTHMWDPLPGARHSEIGSTNFEPSGRISIFPIVFLRQRLHSWVGSMATIG